MASKPDEPKPRRRWLQFSLRTFFALLTVFGVWLGWTVNRAKKQEEAVEWVREMGGWVLYDYELDEDGNQIMDAIPPGPTWLRESLGPGFLDDVVQAQVAGHWSAPSHSHIMDATPLAELTGLQRLYLNYNQVSDLTPLTGLTSLQELWLDYTQVSDLTPLAGLKSLEWRDLKNTPVKNLTPLAGLRNLEALWLDNTPVSKEQVEELRKALPNCNISWSPPDPSP